MAKTVDLEIKAPGDPVLVLIAQVNRWRAYYGQPLFPMKSDGITHEVATLALAIMVKRYAVEMAQALDLSQLNEIAALQAAYNSDPTTYVKENVNAVGYALFRYGDALKLPRAIYGYGSQTVPKWLVGATIGGGVIAVVLLAATLLKRRSRSKSLPAAI